MEQKMFVIRDNKMGVFNTPFFHASDVIAVRSLQMAMGDKTLQLSFFPEDYELYELGVYDDNTAGIKLHAQPKFVIAAITVKAMEEKRMRADIERRRRVEAEDNAQTPSKESL